MKGKSKGFRVFIDSNVLISAIRSGKAESRSNGNFILTGEQLRFAPALKQGGLKKVGGNPALYFYLVF